jgi:hypothetical protein
MMRAYAAPSSGLVGEAFPLHLEPELLVVVRQRCLAGLGRCCCRQIEALTHRTGSGGAASPA